MIAVDTNILVYAHRRDSGWHDEAASAMKRLAEAPAIWAIPWPCLHEFLAIVTHSGIYRPATTVREALDQLAAWLESPSLSLLAEGPGYAEDLARLVEASRVQGARIHDARIAALCLHHGVRELWSADRDFSRFEALTVRNALTA